MVKWRFGKLELSEESRVFSKTAGFGKLETQAFFMEQVPSLCK